MPWRVERPQQAVGEVKARRRRGDGARPARVDGLVVVAVALIGSAVHVGRQRHGAVALQRLVERPALAVEDEAHLRPVAGLDGGGEALGKADHVARPQAPRRLGEGPASIRPTAAGAR